MREYSRYVERKTRLRVELVCFDTHNVFYRRVITTSKMPDINVLSIERFEELYESCDDS